MHSSHSFDDIFHKCRLCCIFNGIHERFMIKESEGQSQDFNISNLLERSAYDWTPERGYIPGEYNVNSYPRPAVGKPPPLPLSLRNHSFPNEILPSQLKNGKYSQNVISLLIEALVPS